MLTCGFCGALRRPTRWRGKAFGLRKQVTTERPCPLAYASVDGIQNIPQTHPYAVVGKGFAMHLTKLAGCSGGTCPTLFATDRGTYVVQGAIVTDPDALAAMNLPEHETAVEVPASLFAGLHVER